MNLITVGVMVWLAESAVLTVSWYWATRAEDDWVGCGCFTEESR